MFDDPANSAWRPEPPFESAGGGLVSTHRRLFCLQPHDAEQGPARPRADSVARRRGADDFGSSHARSSAPARKSFSAHIAAGASAWRWTSSADDIFHTPGRFGWDGGFGTSAYTDPAEGMIGILFTQRMMDSPEPPKVFTDFWTLAYAAME